MPKVVLEIDQKAFERIDTSFLLARANEPSAMGLTSYWDKHRALISVEKKGEKVVLSGESGFYFPGASYSGLDMLNTWDKYLCMRSVRENGKFSLPKGMGYDFFGRRISYDFIRAWDHVDAVTSAYPSLPEAPSILEIGSGSGMQAYVFLQAFPEATYVMVDLPETLSLAAIFLEKVAPTKKRLYYQDWMEQGFTPGALIFVPYYEVGKIPDGFCNLAVNTDSMQEMNYETIENYFIELRRILRAPGLFYQSNRQAKKMDGVMIEVDKLPYLPQERHLMKKKNAFMERQWIISRHFRFIRLLKRIRRFHVRSLTAMKTAA
jgi:putative sugar O-methyltransferase